MEVTSTDRDMGTVYVGSRRIGTVVTWHYVMKGKFSQHQFYTNLFLAKILVVTC